VLGRVNIGSVTALVFDPSFYIGFTNRRLGNRQDLNLPFWFYFQATDVVVPFVGAAPKGRSTTSFTLRGAARGRHLVRRRAKRRHRFFDAFSSFVGAGRHRDWRSLYFLGRFRF
jgi:hypothetical protein